MTHRGVEQLKLTDESDGRTYEVHTKHSEGFFSSNRIKLLVGLVVFVLVVIAIIVLAVLLTHSSDSSSDDGSQVKRRTCPSKKNHRVIMISMDGFRGDYLTRGISPNIMKLANNGVRAKFLQPQFPTKTYPNHYSTATGLYPASHGIVANRFFDPSLNDSFSIGGKTALERKWWGGEPVWMTAEKQNLSAACYFWVGSEAEGLRPSIYYKYNQSHSFPARVDKILEWLDLPTEASTKQQRRPDLIMGYFHEPDYTGHRAGPNSDKVNAQIKRVDDMIGLLYDGIKKRSLENEVDLILVSDHGMATTSCQRVVYLDKYNVTLDDIYTTQTYGGAFISMSPKANVTVKDLVDRLQCKNRYVKVYKKEGVPKRLHYSNSTRIGDVIAIPEDGWLVGTNSSRPVKCTGGTHGYDNVDRDMQAMFVAHGPSFRKGLVVEHFQNIEVYNMVAGLLGLKPAPNDGTAGSLSHLLDKCSRPPVPRPTSDGRLFRTDTCQFPSKEVFEKRLSCQYCICPYCEFDADEVVERDRSLDVSEEQAALLHKRHLPWGLPEGGAGDGGCILTQQGFVTGYSTNLRIPLWVAYHLTGEDAAMSTGRANCFRRDVRLTGAQTSTCSHYYNSSFDRGHMAPNGDMNYSNQTALNSFLFSNMAPQYSGFNRGIWASLENLVRRLSEKFSSIHVITGSIFDEDADGRRDSDSRVSRWLKDTPGTVAIPTHFYKIITRCDESKSPFYEVPDCRGRLDVISFILPHAHRGRCKSQKSDQYLLDHLATVRDIELLTGTNFFGDLPPEEQARIKTISPVEMWEES